MFVSTHLFSLSDDTSCDTSSSCETLPESPLNIQSEKFSIISPSSAWLQEIFISPAARSKMVKTMKMKILDSLNNFVSDNKLQNTLPFRPRVKGGLVRDLIASESHMKEVYENNGIMVKNGTILPSWVFMNDGDVDIEFPNYKLVADFEHALKNEFIIERKSIASHSKYHSYTVWKYVVATSYFPCLQQQRVNIDILVPRSKRATSNYTIDVNSLVDYGDHFASISPHVNVKNTIENIKHRKANLNLKTLQEFNKYDKHIQDGIFESGSYRGYGAEKSYNTPIEEDRYWRYIIGALNGVDKLSKRGWMFLNTHFTIDGFGNVYSKCCGVLQSINVFYFSKQVKCFAGIPVFKCFECENVFSLTNGVPFNPYSSKLKELKKME